MPNYAIVLLANKDFLEYSKQVFYTARRYGNWSYDMLLLGYDLPENTDLDWFKSNQISVIDINAEKIPLTQIDKHLRVYYAKLFLVHPYFSKYDKIIYLDCDIIIRKDINKLLTYDAFAAANDYMNVSLGYQFTPPKRPISECKLKGLFPKSLLRKNSFNTGVMIIHTKRNNLDYFNEIIELTNKYGKWSMYFEQGILNLFFLKNERRKRVPFIYNDIYRVSDFDFYSKYIKVNEQDSVIMHFFYKFKPWEPTHPNHNEWKKNLELANRPWQFKQDGIVATRLQELKVDLFYNYTFLKKRLKKMLNISKNEN